MLLIAHMNALSAMVVSKNRLEGSLADTPLRDLLASCHKHLVTGAIKVFDDHGHRQGVLVLSAGAVDQVRFGDAVGDTALAEMDALTDGSYELAQQLPDLSGELGRAAALEGAVEQVSIVQMMRHCERNALSAVITIVNEFDRGEIHYRAGELEKVTLNGDANEDAIVAMLGWPKARYRVSAPPLPSEIAGWPKVGREQTQPFRIDEAMLAPSMQAARKRHDDKMAKLPSVRAQAGEGFAALPLPLPPAQPFAPVPAPRGSGIAGTIVQAFLLTLTATLVLLFVALMASR